jgi:hypothetical protein
MSKARTKAAMPEGDFGAFFQDAYNDVTPEQSAQDRRKREKSMRTPHGDGRSAKFTGRTEQFNCMVKPSLKARVKAKAKKLDVSITAALEQALEAWLAAGEGGQS